MSEGEATAFAIDRTRYEHQIENFFQRIKRNRRIASQCKARHEIAKNAIRNMR